MKKARIKLYDEQPFFGHLVQHLNLIETERLPTAGVDDRNNLFYNPDFISGLSDEEVEGVLCHEVMHLALECFGRVGERNKSLWNIAQDIIINNIIIQNEGEIPEMAIVPQNNKVTLEQFGTLENIDDEYSESVYAWLRENQPEERTISSFDELVEGDGDEEGAAIPEEAEEIEESDEFEKTGKGTSGDVEWSRELEKAAHQSKGDTPAGVEGLIDSKRSDDVDWRTLVRTTISELNPYSQTYRRPHKNSHSVGYYIPSQKKDGEINVIAVLDTSGSVSDKHLSKFVGEVINIINTYERIDLTVIQHDAEVQDVETYTNPTAKSFQTFEIAGRGGTSHVPVFNHIEDEDLSDSKTIIVCMTDGYTSVPEQVPTSNSIIWVVNNHDIGMERLKHGTIARIDPYHNNE